MVTLKEGDVIDDDMNCPVVYLEGEIYSFLGYYLNMQEVEHSMESHTDSIELLSRGLFKW